MEIGYRIRALEIAGFRGIPRLRVALPEKAPLYLIGANNAGKSTIINAFALALRGGGFHTFVPDEFDFFHGPDGNAVDEFVIDLELLEDDGALPAVQGVGNPTDVHGLRVTGTLERGGRRSHRHVLVGSNGKPITYSHRTALKGAAKEQYQDQGLGWSPRYARPDDIRTVWPDVWLITPENLERSLYHWKTGPLSKLSQLLSDRFLSEEWDFEYDEKPRKMPKTLHNVHAFFRDAVDQFPFWKNELRPKLEDALSKYVGRQAAVRLRPDIQTIEEWLAQQLAAAFAADEGGAVTPLERMGAGWQALVRVAALDVLRDYPEMLRERVVLLCEEPETYLHAHLRRRLRDVFEDLAAQGWVVVAATHSSDFVSFGATQQVQRLWREGPEVVAASLTASRVARSAQLQEKLEERGNHEFLFASRAVFVEGKDDAFALRTALDKLGTDLDGRSISVVSVGGAENLADYARIASQLQIPWCAVTDEDILPDGTVNERTESVRETLRAMVSAKDVEVMWKGSLESCLGKASGKATPSWQSENIEPMNVDALEEAFPEYVGAARRIHEWATANAAPAAAS